MKYKKEILVTIVITILVLFLRWMNILQIENNLGKPLSMLFLILLCSSISIFVQNNIDKNHDNKVVNYKNIDILKYICAILIIILHLRPFQNFSDQLDLAFNNIITRICVPMFFLITGYFIAKKEKKNANYIKDYIKKTIPLYLVWSAIYIPVIIAYGLQNISIINNYITTITIPMYLLIPLIVLGIPLALLVALIYTGVYYHLWYFPALILSLLVLSKWKKKFNIKYLLVISFFLLLFGATETYYGMLPLNLKELLSYYYNIFFTTRNFLFFGLFYVVLGYFMGSKKDVYSKYCFEKLVVCIFFLIFEAIFLHDIERLNSNILLSCIPLTYYLFITTIYLTNKIKLKFDFRSFSKYYYLIHPMIIYIISLFGIFGNNPYLQIVFVLIITHIISFIIIWLKNKNKKLII